MNAVEDRLIDEEVEELPGAIIEGAFRSLCAAMLLRTITEFSTDRSACKERINRKLAAQQWLFRGGGLISFREACDACRIPTQVFRDAVVEFADNPDSRPNNKWRKQKIRRVFGRPNRACHELDQSQAADGVVPSHSPLHRARRGA